MKLLFVLAEWHGLAKLRLHTDATIDLFRQTTTLLGDCFRDFKDNTWSKFDTRELKREYDVRKRRAKRASKSTPNPSAAGVTPKPVKEPTGRLNKTLNLDLIKIHFLGDYPMTIPWYGTTDSYSTQLVCVYN